MKNTELLKNQIIFFRNQKKRQIEELHISKEKGDISDFDYNMCLKSRQGALSALDLNLDDINLSTKIMDDLKMYFVAKNSLEVNFLDKQDKNISLFHLTSGAADQLMLLLTVPENPLSACPLNVDILLSQSINKLNEELETAINVKDKKKIADIKADIKITKELYDKNLALLKNG